MTKLVQHIVSLSETIGAHHQVSHWSVSKMVSSKSDLIDRLKKGGDVNTRTYEAIMDRFDEIWPTDLTWPSGVPRPERKKAA